MPDRPPDRNIRISVRTTLDTKARIAKAAAHHGMPISTYMKLCTVEHMQAHGLWSLTGRVNQQKPGKEHRPRLSDLREVMDPDDCEESSDEG